ncbi:MAG: YciI family protein [Myxococcota bacterium]
MQYLLLIYSEESETNDPAEMQRWFDVTAAMKESGVFVAGEALLSVSTATTVRARNGEVLHTDGPFAETKEQLGGFYLIDVADADEALAWARRLPTVDYGSVEVRPIMALPDSGA